MFRKYENDYNPKIDFKVINLLNPKHDVINNYFEKVAIFKHGKPSLSEQGRWFRKIMNIYNYLLTNEYLTYSAFVYAAQQLETEIDFLKIKKIIDNYPFKEDITHQAVWLCYHIWREKVIGKYSYVLAVVMMNSILKNNHYIPMIFIDRYVLSIDKLLNDNITVETLYKIFSIYHDMSIKYVDKYDLVNKETILNIIEENKEKLIKEYNVKNIWLFGSFSRDEATEYSDVDIYIEFSIDKCALEEEEVKKYLEKIFKRRVDMHVEGKVYERFAPNGKETRELVLSDN